jgi:EAL domain-containing protein (putative c-di-GMP-specific phosphodiesterase class I)
MTYHIIDKAAEQCARWLEQGIELSMAVNLSARLVHDPNIPDVVQKALTKYGLDPSYFELEITETAVMLDPARAMDVLNKLDSMGVYLSIDDFGSGYTSLAYLKKLPVDAVKIDRSFVMNMLRDANDALVVHSIIDLAHNMSRSVVAEGVENKKILDELALLSCNTVQGYHFTKPLPAKDFELWLENYNNQKDQPRSSGFANR